ncbi:host cell division inhibitor Icd-like protein [Escherichia coli]|uniref:host cell division inhibitor Icd-like protein n=1 Tax=Escherichia coli TaxID=562 RepID=UPI00301D7E50
MILNEPAAQKEAFNLAGLLTNVNPQNLIKPKVVNDYLLSIVMAKELAKISLNLSKPDIHARGMTTNDDILNQEIITSKKLIVGNKFPLLAGGMNWIATVVNRSTSTFATNTRALEDLLGIVTREGEFSESIKKSLPLCGNTVYGYKAPHKTGAGIRTPQAIEAIHDAPASFFVSAHTHTLSMVGCMGLTSVRLVSLIASSPNPVQSTASELRTSGGGYKPSIKEAAIMATTPTQKPQFIWIIAAVRRDMPTITAKIHHIAAETEQEARRILARDHVCFFAGRIRTGGAHA